MLWKPPAQRAPGEVWEDESGRYIRCRECGGTAGIVNRYWDDPRNGTVDHHGRPGTDGVPCPAWGVASDLVTALRRDANLNGQEQAAYDFTSRYLTSCRGALTLTDGSTEPCHHPVCMRRMDEGLRWTLMGWR
jgi:hypothetical protein